MFGKHVTPDLSAFCHDELPAERARAVAAHVERCARCREEYDEIRFGVALAGHIARARAPESLWNEIESRLDAPNAPPARVWRRALAYAALLVFASAASLGLWYYEFRERLEVVTTNATPSAFEVAARDAQVRRLADALEFDFVTSSPQMVRAWIRQHAGFDVNLAVERPPEDSGRFRVLGAKIVQAGGARAALVGYEIDSHPVTLLSAPLREVRDPPADLALKKRVAYRLGSEPPVKLLTWGASGLAYVLVSDLPGRGTEACSICHTSTERRRLIREAPLKAAR